MVNVYILQLSNGKYYVGKSTLPKARILDHFRGHGSAWTRQYPPISVLRVIKDCGDFDEDKVTKETMQEYGIDNVRGGSYPQLVLDSAARAFLERELRMSTDVCVRCGRNSHFRASCFAKTHVDGRPLSDDLSGLLLHSLFVVFLHTRIYSNMSKKIKTNLLFFVFLVVFFGIFYANLFLC